MPGSQRTCCAPLSRIRVAHSTLTHPGHTRINIPGRGGKFDDECQRPSRISLSPGKRSDIMNITIISSYKHISMFRSFTQAVSTPKSGLSAGPCPEEWTWITMTIPISSWGLMIQVIKVWINHHDGEYFGDLKIITFIVARSRSLHEVRPSGPHDSFCQLWCCQQTDWPRRPQVHSEGQDQG